MLILFSPNYRRFKISFMKLKGYPAFVLLTWGGSSSNGVSRYNSYQKKYFYLLLHFYMYINDKNFKGREGWMIYRGSVFLSVVWFGSSPNPFPPCLSRQLPLFLSLPMCRRSSLLAGDWEGGDGPGAESYDRKKARPSINRSILSV